MAHYDLKTSQLRDYVGVLKAGDTVSLTGTVYTARDAAHKKILAALENGEQVPFDIQDSVVYYAGPTPAKPGQVIGSCGPTTSGRMDPFSPTLIEKGQVCMIGKGVRNQKVHDAMQKYGCVYMVAIGGAGAVIADSVKSLEVVAYDEAGLRVGQAPDRGKLSGNRVDGRAGRQPVRNRHCTVPHGGQRLIKFYRNFA